MSKRVEPAVEKILAADIDGTYKNSSKRLLLKFWEQEGLYLTSEQQHLFMLATPAGSITRARRALKGKYPASKAVTEARYQKFIVTRNEYGEEVVII